MYSWMCAWLIYGIIWLLYSEICFYKAGGFPYGGLLFGSIPYTAKSNGWSSLSMKLLSPANIALLPYLCIFIPAF